MVTMLRTCDLCSRSCRMCPSAGEAGRFGARPLWHCLMGTERFVEGMVEGAIIREPRGTGGFGYDPIFVPLGMHETFAELPAERKDAMSHRGQAMAALVPVLAELLG